MFTNCRFAVVKCKIMIILKINVVEASFVVCSLSANPVNSFPLNVYCNSTETAKLIKSIYRYSKNDEQPLMDNRVALMERRKNLKKLFIFFPIIEDQKFTILLFK